MRTRTLIALSVACLAAASAVFSFSSPSAQAATCGGAQTYAGWGDFSTYIPMVNGGLENGSASWSPTGAAAVVSGNEHYHVGQLTDSHSLSLPAGSSATVHAFCLGMLYPRFRLFVQNAGASAATLRVDVTYKDLFGITHREVLAYLTGRPSWEPSPALTFLDPSAALATQTNGQIWLSLTPVGTGGSWRIDDAYVDPYKMH